MNGLKFYNDFYKLLETYNEAYNLVRYLEENSEVLVFGGAVRDYYYDNYKFMPRDFDLVLNNNISIDLDCLLSKYSFSKNRFGGYKIIVDNITFDIWNIDDTWAFKEKKLKCVKKDYARKLPDTVFLNIDSVVYNLNVKEFNSKRFETARKKGTLDIVLKDNPYIELNLLRALVFKNKYKMNLSSQLIDLFKAIYSENNRFCELLYNIQFSHYGEEQLSKKIIDDELNDIINLRKSKKINYNSSARNNNAIYK